MLIALCVLTTLLAVGALAAYMRERGRVAALRERYLPVVNIDEAVAKSQAELAGMAAKHDAELERAKAEMAQAVSKSRGELERAQAELLALTTEQQKKRQALHDEYATARATYDRLRKEINLLEEHTEDISFGLYQPHYNFGSSVAYRAELDRVRDAQKKLIRDGKAAASGIAWAIGGDKRAGEKMQKEYLKLMLRAFNGECDAAIANVSWNNVSKMEARIQKSFEAVNALGGVMTMSILPAYLDLKIAELRLEYEAEEKKHVEQEEQRLIKEQMREEERALREAEKAKRDAEAEEARNQKALDLARAEISKAQGAALEQLQQRIQHLDAALQRAKDLKDKATTMAQLTRSGHVYVISNIGSFGENVFKIGMTRRLEPMDRIKELGDASVPFDFDVHALVYCEDAPKLEGAFHGQFEARRVNMVNDRKEFFAVSIDEIEAFAATQAVQFQLTKLAEAKQYRQTLAMREAAAPKASAPAAAFDVEFPAAI